MRNYSANSRKNEVERNNDTTKLRPRIYSNYSALNSTPFLINKKAQFIFFVDQSVKI